MIEFFIAFGLGVISAFPLGHYFGSVVFAQWRWFAGIAVVVGIFFMGWFLRGWLG